MSQRKHVMPVPPNIVAKVIQLASDPDCGVPELSAVIKADPVLTAQVLKAVNSPFYALRRKISSVDRGVSFMGIRAVRNLVLCFGVRELSPPKADYPLELFWECSLRRAAAAKILAVKKGLPEADEVFTLGLCQDLGALEIIGASEETAKALSEVARQPASERRKIEAQFGETHDELGALLFEEWSFPEEVKVPVQFHHNPDECPESHRLLAQIAHGAEALADLLEMDDKQAGLKYATLQMEKLGIQEDDLSPLLDELSEAVEAAAEMLNIKVGHQPSFQEIAEQASQGLLALNMSYQSLTEQLQDSLKHQQQMAERLEQLNADLEQRAMTDELTGLANRRAFDEALVRELERAKRLDKPLCLAMLDVDKFKVFNDTHGHQAGDEVLKSVGAELQKNARACDFAARFGGEEFSIILPHTPVGGAKIAANRVRKSIEQMEVEYEGKILKVTVSIGVAQVKDPGHKRAPTRLIRSADDALYEAKEEGRNCVIVAEDD